MKSLKMMEKNNGRMQMAPDGMFMQPQLEQQKLSTFSQLPLELMITQTLIKEDDRTRKPYTEYVIQVNLNSKKWSVHRKYKKFGQLNEALVANFPNVKFPQSASQFNIKSLSDIMNIKKNLRASCNHQINSSSGTVIEDRRKALQEYLSDISMIPIIRDSALFKSFIEMEDHTG